MCSTTPARFVTGVVYVIKSSRRLIRQRPTSCQRRAERNVARFDYRRIDSAAPPWS
jgi:hypothetical protein